MIYDPITRQVVCMLGRYAPQQTCYRFGREQKGEFRFVKVRYGEHLPGFSGGFEVGQVRDVDINNLVADGGSREIHEGYEQLPLIEEGTWQGQH